MTIEEKAARRAARKAAQAAKLAREREDHSLIAEAARGILKDSTAKASEKLIALAVLDETEMYHIVPRALRNAGQELTAFSEILKAATEDTTT